jgi:predicted nucleotidyltransferase
MKLPSQLEALNKIIEILEKNSIEYMLIGGWALPAYGHIRATIDIDLAIAVKQPEKLDHFISELRSNKYQVTFNPKTDHPVFPILDEENMVEMELWQKPDGIDMGAEILKRRRKIRKDNLSFWIIGPEDLIINKLAIPNRSSGDEQDVITVLHRQRDKLDRHYLENRARQAGLLSLLEALEGRITEISHSYDESS